MTTAYLRNMLLVLNHQERVWILYGCVIVVNSDRKSIALVVKSTATRGASTTVAARNGTVDGANASIRMACPKLSQNHEIASLSITQHRHRPSLVPSSAYHKQQSGISALIRFSSKPCEA
jgi:hypothetical protein